MELPKYLKSNKKGRNGLNILTKIVENELGWIVRPNHQEDDFGIDAYIDIVLDEYLTGKSIAIQIKSGDSYFKEINNDFWNFHGEKKHLNYYLNQDIPVLIVLVDLNNEIAYWEVCIMEYVNLQTESWTMPIPKKQQINLNQKEELLRYVSKNVDYVSQLEEYWKGNKTLSECTRIYLFAGKEDILEMNYQPLIDLITRICSNKLHLSQFRENIEIGIHGYDNDQRELFQIQEVKKWVTDIFTNVPGLTYFLVNDQSSQFLKLFLYSTINIIQIVKGKRKNQFKIEYDSSELKSVFDLLFTDLNDFTAEFGVTLEINEQISKHILKCLSGKEAENN
jgi:hypothetical protein